MLDIPVLRRGVLLGALCSAVAVVSAVSLSAGPAAAAEELNALVWCDHADPNLLRPFEEQYGVRVNVKEYEGTGTALSILEQSQPGDWDVFVVDGVDVPRVVEAGLLAELDPKDFPMDDLFPGLPEIQTGYVDGKLYAVTEKFGYNAISYNRDKVDPADMRKTSVAWSDKYAGRIAIYDYYIPVMNIVAIGLGMRPDETNAENLSQIRDKLFEMKEKAAMVGEVVSVQTALATGEVDIIIGGGEWVTGVLNADNPAMQWVLPDEGGVRWSQSLGVFAGSKRKDLATKFVQYVLSPEGQARLATSSCYWAMPSNTKAALTPEQKAVLRWDEQSKFIDNSYPYFIPDAELDAKMLDVWTEFLQH